MIVTTRHMLTIPGFSTRNGYCRGGSRKWARSHGLDWEKFVREGIDSEILEATDGFGQALVKWARECEAREAGRG